MGRIKIKESADRRKTGGHSLSKKVAIGGLFWYNENG